jgi:putative membrane protein|tara:strand:- start:22502 stop:23698 length:1197 start_codon:yes stop_codon:yes gene_type:complete
VILEIMVATLLGMIFGVFTGLTPGIHLNLIATLVLSSSVYLLGFVEVIVLAVFIVSMSVVHTFMNAIPAIYLGAPEDEGNALNVLPGHKMLLEGKGYEALLLTVIGSFLALIVGILVSPLIIKLLPNIYEALRDYIGYILIIIVVFLILRERKKYLAFFVFILAGVFGLTVLNLNLKNPMFPMLSSLFGIAGLLISLKDKVEIPIQEITETDISKMEVGKAVGVGTLVGSFATMMPGLGPAQAAIMGSQIVKLSDKGFLVLVGALDTLGMVMSFVALFAIEKARNGVVVVISRLIGVISKEDLIVFFSVAFITGIIAAGLSLWTGRKFSSLITKINYEKLAIGIIVFIIGMCLWLSSWLGLLVLVIGSFLGMVPVLLNVGRNHLMGCLLLPVILFFLL